MATAHVTQVANRDFGLNSTFVTWSITTTGNAVAGTVFWNTDAGQTLVSVSGCTLVGSTITGSGWSSRGFYKENCTSGSLTITATLSAASPDIRLIAHEASGVKTSGVLDVHATQHQGFLGTGTDFITSGGVTVQAGSYISGFTTSQFGSLAAAGTGFTIRQNASSMFSESLIQGSGGTRAATFTPGDNDGYHTWMIALLDSAGGGGGGGTIAKKSMINRQQQGMS